MNDIEPVLLVLQRNLLDFNADALVDAVLLSARTEQLAVGTRLPTIAVMARTLGLSTSTVSRAWASLVQMGVIETKRRGGTRIARPVEATAYRFQGLERERFQHFLAPGYPDPALQVDLGFMLRRVAEQASFAGYAGKDDISEVLRSSLLRCIGYEPESMLLDTEVIGALPRVLQAVSHRGASIGVGNPEFPLYGVILKQSGMSAAPISFSDQGYDIDEMDAALRSGVRVVLLQTRVHSPTGCMVPTENLEKIGALLKRHDATAIEVDHHGELVPNTAVRLASIAPERTVLIRSFAKEIHPDVRVSVIAGPSSIIDRIAVWRAGGQWVSSVSRALLEACLDDPKVELMIGVARQEYDRRRGIFQDALARRGISSFSNAGLNFWVPVVSEQETLLRLAAQSISVAPGAAFISGPNLKPHIHLSLGCVGEEAEMLSEHIADAAAARSGEHVYFQ